MCRRCSSDGALTSTFLLSHDDLMIVVKSLAGYLATHFTRYCYPANPLSSSLLRHVGAALQPQ